MATTDITDLSDAALDAVIAVKTGADFVDASKLSVADRYAVARALGWEMTASVSMWCRDAEYDSGASPHCCVGPDFEAMILDRQLDDYL